MVKLKGFPVIQKTISKKQFLLRKKDEKPQDYYTRAFFELLKSDIEEIKDKGDLLKKIKESSEIMGKITGTKEESSFIDPLTNLYNRRGFFENVKELGRFKEDMTLACIDLDGLKIFNDTFGHEAGDILLVIFASAIKSEKRPCDVAARFGGDEFNVWIFGSNLEGAEKLMKRIQGRFDESIKNSFKDLGSVDKPGFTFTLGKWQGEDIKEFVYKIDKELMRKKQEKKKNGQIYSSSCSL